MISVDTEKKELIGEYKNGGREYEPRGKPQQVKTHDFGDRDANDRVQRSIPYGVYDQGQNQGWVSVGVDHDTAAFAVVRSASGGNGWDRRRTPAAAES